MDGDRQQADPLSRGPAASDRPGTPGRLAYLSHARVPSEQANSFQIVRMCEAFAQAGYRVELWCRRSRAPLARILASYGVRTPIAIHGLRLPRVPVLSRVLYTALTLARLALRPAPALYYARDPYLLGTMVALGLARAPFALELHHPPTSAIERHLIRRILGSPLLARVVVISDALAREVVTSFGSEVDGIERKITVARDAAEVPEAPAAGAEGERPTDELKVGYVGSLGEGKGVDFLLKVAARLPGMRFHVVGGGERLAELKRRASSNVTFHGFCEPARVPRVMAGFDVALAPYLEQVRVGQKGVDVAAWMSPLKAFEYMAAGCPMVASDLPVLREFLTDGETALLAAPGDVDDWVRCLERLGADRLLRSTVAGSAYRLVLAQHTWTARARRILEAVGEDVSEGALR